MQKGRECEQQRVPGVTHKLKVSTGLREGPKLCQVRWLLQQRRRQPSNTSVNPRSHNEQEWEALLWTAPSGTTLSLLFTHQLERKELGCVPGQEHGGHRLASN